jgi:hypothetical protein
VIASGVEPGAAVIRPPVVSKSTTMNVVSRNDTSNVGSVPSKLSCVAPVTPTVGTLSTRTDRRRFPRRVRRRVRRRAAGA